MEDYTVNCPDEQKIWDYTFEKLSFEESQSIEKHLCFCNLCIEAVRKASFAYDMYQSTIANPLLGTLWDTGKCDMIFLRAAGSETENGISEFRSEQGRYIIRIIPFLDENKSVLEIEMMDGDADGTVIVGNRDGVLLNSPVVNRHAHSEIRNDTDIGQLFISFRKIPERL